MTHRLGINPYDSAASAQRSLEATKPAGGNRVKKAEVQNLDNRIQTKIIEVFKKFVSFISTGKPFTAIKLAIGTDYKNPSTQAKLARDFSESASTPISIRREALQTTSKPLGSKKLSDALFGDYKYLMNRYNPDKLVDNKLISQDTRRRLTEMQIDHDFHKDAYEMSLAKKEDPTAAALNWHALATDWKRLAASIGEEIKRNLSK